MRRALLLAIAAALIAPAAPAQKAPRPILRPELEAGADTNDADVYYEYAMREKTPWKKTHDALYWAYRLQPDRTYLLHALQIAMFNRQPVEWRWEYFDGAGYVVKSKEAQAIDSIAYEVAMRNPMVYLRSRCYRIRGLEDERDHLLVASIHFEYGCYRDAADRYAKALVKHPKRHWIHLSRAHALYRAGSADSAIGELQILLDSLRGRDRKQLVRRHESRAIFEFMIGNLYTELRNYPAAREAYGRALVEDLSLYHVHARLADIALIQRDTRTALLEYEQAVALKEDDGVLRHDLGFALMNAGRHADAEPHLRRAVELEPFWATPYYNLAVALDRQDKRHEARDMYGAFLTRAPRGELKMINTSHARIAALSRADTATVATPQQP